MDSNDVHVSMMMSYTVISFDKSKELQAPLAELLKILDCLFGYPTRACGGSVAACLWEEDRCTVRLVLLSLSQLPI